MINIISSNQLKKEEVEKILARAEKMEEDLRKGTVEQILKDKIVACIFFEPSTRTRLSFETAALRLGAKVISSENAMENSSAYKGEKIEDTTKVLCSYADVIVIRHPIAGTLEKAALVTTKPIINAGDGAILHPTQGLLDVYTIKKEHKRIDNLTIGFGGDLLNSRTVKSLVPFLRQYNGNKFYFISPKELELPREYIKELKDAGVVFEELRSLEEALPKLDILYMTRVQKERFANVADYEKVKDLFILRKDHLKKMKNDAIIMHALPKVNEIESEVDADSRAVYFRQAQNGLYVRMALLCYALGL
ncbi:MAG: aspartate carbamoyltransferase [Candidatus Pacebacteria bacterium]|nr:aspartate carbamoyltransferase [Candidatus Paceibacterota bacterium]